MRLDDRVIESSNIFEGKRFDVRDSLLRQPQVWSSLWNPFRPSWGEPYKDVVARMWPAVLDARAEAEGHEAVVVSHQLPIWMTRLQGRGTPVPARPAQAPLHPVQPDLVHLRGRAPRQRRLLRARRRPDPGRRPERPVLRRWRRRRHPAAFRAAFRTLGLRCAPPFGPCSPCSSWARSLRAAVASAGTGDKGYVDGQGIVTRLPVAERKPPGPVAGDDPRGQGPLADRLRRQGRRPQRLGVVVPAVPQGGPQPRGRVTRARRRRRRLRRGEHQGLQPRAGRSPSSGATRCRTPPSSTRPDARCSRSTAP